MAAATAASAQLTLEEWTDLLIPRCGICQRHLLDDAVALAQCSHLFHAECLPARPNPGSSAPMCVQCRRPCVRSLRVFLHPREILEKVLSNAQIQVAPSAPASANSSASGSGSSGSTSRSSTSVVANSNASLPSQYLPGAVRETFSAAALASVDNDPKALEVLRQIHDFSVAFQKLNAERAVIAQGFEVTTAQGKEATKTTDGVRQVTVELQRMLADAHRALQLLHADVYGLQDQHLALSTMRHTAMERSAELSAFVLKSPWIAALPSVLEAARTASPFTLASLPRDKPFAALPAADFVLVSPVPSALDLLSRSAPSLAPAAPRARVPDLCRAATPGDPGFLCEWILTVLRLDKSFASEADYVAYVAALNESPAQSSADRSAYATSFFARTTLAQLRLYARIFRALAPLGVARQRLLSEHASSPGVALLQRVDSGSLELDELLAVFRGDAANNADAAAAAASALVAEPNYPERTCAHLVAALASESARVVKLQQQSADLLTDRARLTQRAQLRRKTALLQKQASDLRDQIKAIEKATSSLGPHHPTTSSVASSSAAFATASSASSSSSISSMSSTLSLNRSLLQSTTSSSRSAPLGPAPVPTPACATAPLASASHAPAPAHALASHPATAAAPPRPHLTVLTSSAPRAASLSNVNRPVALPVSIPVLKRKTLVPSEPAPAPAPPAPAPPTSLPSPPPPPLSPIAADDDLEEELAARKRAARKRATHSSLLSLSRRK